MHNPFIILPAKGWTRYLIIMAVMWYPNTLIYRFTLQSLEFLPFVHLSYMLTTCYCWIQGQKRMLLSPIFYCWDSAHCNIPCKWWVQYLIIRLITSVYIIQIYLSSTKNAEIWHRQESTPRISSVVTSMQCFKHVVKTSRQGYKYIKCDSNEMTLTDTYRSPQKSSFCEDH